MARMIDQIRASKLPSNMMQFAARGALQVSPAENIEILVYLAQHNKVFGDLARMTLAGWDEKASLKVVADPETSQDVLSYFMSHDNLRPKLLPALLENPSVEEDQIVKLAATAMRDTIDILLTSPRVRSTHSVIEALIPSPYLKKPEIDELKALLSARPAATGEEESATAAGDEEETAIAATAAERPETSESTGDSEPQDRARAAALASDDLDEATFGVDDETVFSYLKEHEDAIAAEGEKPFQAIGGIIDMLGADYYPEVDKAEVPADAPAPAASAAKHAVVPAAQKEPAKRLNTVQKINSLDVKGRIQLALKGNKEERSILIRDGTKVVALAVLEAPKLSDGEVEKFASQKNVLEAVLRQIPLKRRFMKNYIVIRNLVSNPRTPLDLSLGLMKHLLTQDLKNLSSNKEVSEGIRKLALKMFKQKQDAANKK